MSRTYWGISPAFWSDEKVTGADDGGEPWSDDAKLLALYLLSCKHRTLEGLFRLPKGYIVEDLGWLPEQLAQPFAELLDHGFIEYDERARLCLLVNALDYGSPQNPNQMTSAIRLLADLPESALFARLLEQAELFCKPFAERLREGLPERYGQSLPLPLPLPHSVGASTSDARSDGKADEKEPEQPEDLPAPIFADIDFGSEPKPEIEPTTSPALVAYYVAESKAKRGSAPLERQVGMVAQMVGEKIAKGANPAAIKAAIRELVNEAKPITALPSLFDKH